MISTAGCESPSSTQKTKEEIYENNAITIGGKLSAASKRAIERNYDQGPEWFCGFRKQYLKGDFQYEEGVIRRDPSAVILVGSTYYVWYTKGEGKAYGFGTGDPSKKVFPWDLTELWYATSKDGWDWKEQGLAVGRGPQGAYDDRAGFIPAESHQLTLAHALFFQLRFFLDRINPIKINCLSHKEIINLWLSYNK